MTAIKRPLAGAGAAVLLALSLTACGGGYPADASSKDFCGGVEAVLNSTVAVAGEEPTEDEWNDIQDAYTELGEIGTPDDIGEDERAGFEVVVDAISDLDYDEAKESFGSEDGSDSIPGVSEDDEADADKFFTYLSTECADVLSGS